MNDKKNNFNLFEEWAKGIMYRGGEEMDDFLSGYVSGLVLFGMLGVALYIIGLSLGY